MTEKREKTEAAATAQADAAALIDPAELKAELDRASDRAGTATLERDRLQAQLERMTADFEEVVRQRDELKASLDAVSREKAALDAKLARANKAKVTPRPRGRVVRTAVPMDRLTPSARDVLFAEIKAAPHEVVFSDGEREVEGLGSFAVAGDAWMNRPRGLSLQPSLKIKPDRPVELAGFALFNAKGKQVAWCALAQPMRIAAGQDVQLSGQVLF